MENDLQKDGDEEMNKFKEQMESLDVLGAVVDRVLKYAKQLSTIPRNQQTSQQKLWLLAYAAVDKKMSPGTSAAMVEVARLLPILDETIE